MAVAATVFAGCKENIVEVSKSGLQLTITADDSYVDKVVKSESAVDFSNFVVSIEKKDGKYKCELWELITAMPERGSLCRIYCAVLWAAPR